MKFRVLTLLLCVALLGASPAKSGLTQDERAALDHVTAADLRADLSFLASDELQGRNTPSHELDIAAAFIASQFRRYGLEPGGDDGYFQAAKMSLVEPVLEGFALEFEDGARTLSVDPSHVRSQAQSKIALSHVPTWKVDLEHVDDLKTEDVQGKALVVVYPDQEKMKAVMKGLGRLQEITNTLNPAVVITLQSASDRSVGTRGGLSDAADNVGRSTTKADLFDAATYKMYDAMKSGLTPVTVSFRRSESTKTPMILRNVMGVIPGSDPVLKDTYVLVTAHYDHLGVKPASDLRPPRHPGEESDRIYNGANDDGSGTVSVMEIAHALATLKHRPKRTLVFMTFFGEEKGEMGSRYYGRHPIYPLDKTVADVNLEQLGRTDSSEGPQIANASFTGFDYSTLVPFFVAAGRETGINVYKHEKNSDAYFSRSDNQNLAIVGVPAHTVGVAFNFSDYHGVGDEWQKIDYDNMAKVDRMLALGVIRLANSAEPPKWNEPKPEVERYVKAWRELHSH